MTFWSILILCFGVGYFLFFRVVELGIILSWYRRNTKNNKTPFVSILVACKNEEKDLQRCVDSLVRLDYLSENIEILLIDDQSSDRTPEIVKTSEKLHNQVKAYNTSAAPDTHLKAKARAISYGASKAKGDWLFIVDADAKVDPKWLKCMLSGTDDKVGMIGGLIMTDEKGYFTVSALEKVSLAYTQPITAGAAGLGFPAICSGPNMAIRRSTYEDYGGLEKVDFDIAEDLALARIVLDSGQKIKFYSLPETVAYLKAPPSLKHLFSQQRRWITGGFEQSWKLWSGLAFVFGYHFILSWILILGWFVSIEATLISLSFKLLSDFILLIVLKLQMKIPRLLRYTPLMFIYTLATFIWLPLSLIFSKNINWKGEGYEVNYG